MLIAKAALGLYDAPHLNSVSPTIGFSKAFIVVGNIDKDSEGKYIFTPLQLGLLKLR